MAQTKGQMLEVDGIRITHEFITPERAEELLDVYNLRNRRMNKKRIEAHAEQMRKNRWRYQTDLIGVSDYNTIEKKPRLLNGQHRLHAIIKSGKTIPFFIMWNLPDDAFEVIDTGKSRSSADVLSTLDVEHSGALSGMVKFIVAFSRGKYSGAANQDLKGKDTITNSEVRIFTQKNYQSLLESYEAGYSSDNKHILTPNMAAGLHYLFKAVDKKKADWFFQRLFDGQDMKKGTPLYMLRNRLWENKAADAKMSQREKLAITIKTWNSELKGEEFDKMVRLRHAKEDAFPVIAGWK